VVPAHGVERYGDWSTHDFLPFRMNDLCGGTPAATPEKRDRNRRKKAVSDNLILPVSGGA
jgi:hypothetical protein